jgi:hypothetical protein
MKLETRADLTKMMALTEHVAYRIVSLLKTWKFKVVQFKSGFERYYAALE